MQTLHAPCQQHAKNLQQQATTSTTKHKPQPTTNQHQQPTANQQQQETDMVTCIHTMCYMLQTVC